MELWRQTLVVTVIAWIDNFQKITISRYHFVCQTKNYWPTPQSNQFSSIDINFQVLPWLCPRESYAFLKEVPEFYQKQSLNPGGIQGRRKYLLSNLKKMLESGKLIEHNVSCSRFDQKWIAEYFLFMLPDSELKQNPEGLWHFSHNLEIVILIFL